MTLERMSSGDITVFMAVPTTYRRLISAWEGLNESDRRSVTEALAGLRLMVSGSAALPVPTLDRWREVSGHTLLERYGMTEIGMELSNPYQGQRTPGAVGRPLPTVELRLVDDDGLPVPDGSPGEIEVQGPSVFREYWQRPQATDEAFNNGWFQTGDIAVVEEGVYRILGRRSVDIIKSGGEKVSALEVEDVLRTHPGIADCAVVGIEDVDWGERVAAAVVVTGSIDLDLEDVRSFARGSLAAFKLPRQLIIVDELPRNALGKVVKPRVKEMIPPGTGA
jgi:malonyl-CoA/methylmalonyl-CoA synthetase